MKFVNEIHVALTGSDESAGVALLVQKLQERDAALLEAVEAHWNAVGEERRAQVYAETDLGDDAARPVANPTHPAIIGFYNLLIELALDVTSGPWPWGDR